MARFGINFERRILISFAAWSFLTGTHSHAGTTSWNTDASGSFTTAANWDNGVPDSDDTAVFNRGFVAYTVTFPGGFIFDPPVIYTIDSLRVRTNEVSFVHVDVPFQSAPSLSVLNPGESIIVAENAGDVAILNMTLNSLSGANASIGRNAGARGTLNVGGTFNLSGALTVGESGTGTMNVTNGATVTSANGFIGPNASSSGQVTVSGAGSTWANSNSLIVGGGNFSARLDVNDGGVVSATNGLRVNPSGQLAGNGLVQGNVENLGHVVPGIYLQSSVGTLHIDGNYGQSIAARLFVQLAAANSFDKLDIDGNITFGGTLDVSLGYSPALGATFDILDWTGTQTGTFFNIVLPPPVGLMWNKSQLYTSGVLSVVTGYFQPGDVIAYAQAEWGLASTAAGMILNSNYNTVYTSTSGIMEVGIPGASGHSIQFTSANALFAYMPSSGAPAPLNADLLDPIGTASGVFGGEVTALKLNVDFSDAGLMVGTLGIPFGDLVIHDYPAVPQVNGLTVREFLAQANVALGGGAVPYSISSVSGLLAEFNDSFFEGQFVSQFAQDHLRIPGDFNLDRAVDAADYVVWRDTDGTPGGYNEWRTHFGWTAGSGSGAGANTLAAIPEPATLMLLSLVVGWCPHRRSNARHWSTIHRF